MSRKSMLVIVLLYLFLYACKDKETKNKDVSDTVGVNNIDTPNNISELLLKKKMDWNDVVLYVSKYRRKAGIDSVSTIYYDLEDLQRYVGDFKKMTTELGNYPGYTWKVGFMPMTKTDQNQKEYIDFCVTPVLVSLAANDTNRAGYQNALDLFDLKDRNRHYDTLRIRTDQKSITSNPTGIYDFGQKDP